jgi:hypothetical protein
MPSRAAAVVLLCRNRQTEFVRSCARNQMACRRERSLAFSAHQVKTSIPASANLRLTASFTRFLGAPDPMSTDAPSTAFSKTTVVEAAQPLQAGRPRGELASAAALEAPETLLFAQHDRSVAPAGCLALEPMVAVLRPKLVQPRSVVSIVELLFNPAYSPQTHTIAHNRRTDWDCP